MTRYPLDPLAHAMGLHLGAHGQRGDGTTPQGLAALATRLNISHRWARHLHHTGLTDTQADHYAIRIGRHPATIWPDWWTHATGDHDWYPDDPPMASLTPSGSYLGETIATP